MSSFDEMCKEAVKRFIKTVAIIDDEATFDDLRPFQEDKDKTKTAISPLTGLIKGNQDVDSSATNEDSTDAGLQDDHDDLSQLDAKVVINAFADIGIACCIQRPEKEETPLDRAAKLAATVDVLVIDWALDNENISLPRDIIQKILEDDKNTGGRMRLIVVYTAQSYVDQMIKDLKEDADAVYDNGLDMDEKRFFIKSNNLRIVILNKKTTLNPLKEARIVPFDELPDYVISEYTKLVKGIIPGATLHGIAAMREKTHELLAILNSNLDGAYCLHRALLHEPSESVDFAMNLITSEIETVIQTDARARQIVEEEGLKSWLEDYALGNTTLPCCDSSLSVKTVEECIINGKLSNKNGINSFKKDYSSNLVRAKTDAKQTLEDNNGKIITLDEAEEFIKQNKFESINGGQPPNFLRFVDVLYSTPEGAINGCKELSHLQCTARDIGNRLYPDNSQSPTLQLGTILKKQNEGSCEWFLCLTPLCDCVRLKEESNFLFLQLYPGTKSSADIIIKTLDGTFEPLIVKKEKIRTLTIPFKPTNGSERINANRLENEWLIESNGTNYQWVGELRYTKALAIVHYVAANTSRVGLDEFEWLRLQATLKN
jgi:hypothetical protein